MQLKNKTALVTGSNSGIGLGIATELAKAGANVVLNSFTDRDEDHKLAEDLSKATGAPVRYLKADMSNGDACRAWVEEAHKVFGSVDILVNNAGIQHVAKIEEFPSSKWDAIIAINLSSAFHTSAAAVPLMKAQNWGRIINIASAHGLTASPYKSAYVAAKHGILGLSKTIALEFAEEKIAATCNAICPGYVKTPLVEGQIADQMKAHKMSEEEVLDKIMLTRQPTREFATVEQLGGLALFLASDHAAQITGTSISMDGGWTAM